MAIFCCVFFISGCCLSSGILEASSCCSVDIPTLPSAVRHRPLPHVSRGNLPCSRVSGAGWWVWPTESHRPHPVISRQCFSLPNQGTDPDSGSASAGWLSASTTVGLLPSLRPSSVRGASSSDPLSERSPRGRPLASSGHTAYLTRRSTTDRPASLGEGRWQLRASFSGSSCSWQLWGPTSPRPGWCGL